MIVFCHIPKTGGTSLGQFFINSYPGGYVCSYDLYDYFTGMPEERLKNFSRIYDVDKVKVFASHAIEPIAVRKYIPAAKIVLFLRNPIERVFSEYCYLKRVWQRGLYQFDLLKVENYPVDFTRDFTAYLHSYSKRKAMWRQAKITEFLVLPAKEQIKGLDLCDFVGVMEDFEDSIALLQAKLGIYLKYTGNMQVNDNPERSAGEPYSASCSAEELKIATELLRDENEGYLHALEIYGKEFSNRDKDVFQFHKDRIALRNKFNDDQIRTLKIAWRTISKLSLTRKVLYGTGKYAVALIDALESAELPLPDLILDDAASVEKIYKITVRKFSKEELDENDTVIIASDIPGNIGKMAETLKKTRKKVKLIFPQELTEA